MLDHDQELTLQTLARSIRQCVDTLGPACTARLLGTIAVDLTQADKFADTAVLSIGTQPQHEHGAQP